MCERVKQTFVGTKKSTGVACHKHAACKFIRNARSINNEAKDYIIYLIESECILNHEDEKVIKVNTQTQDIDDRIINKIKELRLNIEKIKTDIYLYENLLRGTNI